MLDWFDTQEKIVAHMKANIDTPLFEQGVPDEQTLRRNSAGKVEPYIAYQFGSIPESFSGKSFAGVRGDDYDMILYVQVVSSSAGIARKISEKVVKNTLLGYEPLDNGEMYPMSGGAMWPINATNGATEAYMFPSSWGLNVQMMDA